MLGLSNNSHVMALKIVVLPVPLSPKMEALFPPRLATMALIFSKASRSCCFVAGTFSRMSSTAMSLKCFSSAVVFSR